MTLLAEGINEIRQNLEQQEAFERAGNCVVLAPPGSGKTKLLTLKMAADLRERIPEPHGAACITYTNAAAAELERRLLALGVARRPNVFIGTVHAFAMREILRPYAALAGRPAALKPIATDRQRTETYLQAENELYGPDERREGLEYTASLRRKHLNYDPGDTLAGGERTSQLATRWEVLLEEAEVTDFELVVRHAVEIVEGNSWVRRVLAARFPHLYLDEYQDLAPGLHRLAQALSFDETAAVTLFAVGDPDQSIMGFNGSQPKQLLTLAEHPQVARVRLQTNYRSRGNIVEKALRALGVEREVLWLEEGGEINQHECEEGMAQQLNTVAEIASELIAAGTVPEEIAVLCPSKYVKRDVRQALESADIPAFSRGDEYRETAATSLIEGLAAWSTQPRGKTRVQLRDLLRQWRMLLDRSRTISRDEALVRLCLENEVGDRRAAEFASQVSSLGLGSRLTTLGRDDERLELDRMLAMLSDGDLKDLDVAGLGRRANAPGQILISTIHAGKGLEFEAVLVVGLDEGMFPSYRATTSAEIEEARRAFYVSLTRAKSRVDLIYSGFTTTQKGYRRANGRCRFIDAL